MENASKALLFAAGILIAIILISVAVYIVSMANESTKNVGSTMTDMEISAFNSKFTTYEGLRTGSQVKSLVEAVNTSNANNAGTDLEVSMNETPKIITKDTQGNYKFDGGSAKKYQVSFEKESGAIKTITVKLAGTSSTNGGSGDNDK